MIGVVDSGSTKALGFSRGGSIVLLSFLRLGLTLTLHRQMC